MSDKRGTLNLHTMAGSISLRKLSAGMISITVKPRLGIGSVLLLKDSDAKIVGSYLVAIAQGKERL